jgi:hypothetical protein
VLGGGDGGGDGLLCGPVPGAAGAGQPAAQAVRVVEGEGLDAFGEVGEDVVGECGRDALAAARAAVGRGPVGSACA